MEAKKEWSMVFLDDRSILPWKREREDTSKHSACGLDLYRGSTTLRKFHGPRTLQTKAEPYQVSASAMMYTADIARKVEGDEDFEGEKYKPKEETFFVGAIQIVDTRKNLANKLLVGKIWYATPDISYSVNYELPRIILNNEINPEKKQKRIEMIIKGYEHQRKHDEGERRIRQATQSSHGGWSVLAGDFW